MQRFIVKSKIHRATVTKSNLNYVGSLTIDKRLMEAADILPYEEVLVWNLNNGERLQTYAIEGKKGSGIICANGAAARLVHPGDKIIIVCFGLLSDEEIRRFKPKVIFVDEKNRIISK